MSRIVTRKQRLKELQLISENQSPKKETNEMTDYFKDCLNLNNDENCAPNNKKHEIKKRNAGCKSKTETLWESTIPAKKGRTALLEINENVRANRSNSYSTSFRSQKSFGLQRNGSHLFNNITESFCSSKILSLQELNEFDNQKRLDLASWGLPALILEVNEL